MGLHGTMYAVTAIVDSIACRTEGMRANRSAAFCCESPDIHDWSQARAKGL